MFTGIVSETGTVREIKTINGGQELVISSSFAADAHVDESIAVNGVCLTVVSFDAKAFRVQCVQETLRKTSLGTLEEGMAVNLERSLTLEKAIEGHIVQGHVDTVGVIDKITQDGADLLVEISYPSDYKDYVVDRGSIAVDGISLTVARTDDGAGGAEGDVGGVGNGEGRAEGDVGGVGNGMGVGDGGAFHPSTSSRFTVAIIPYTWDFTNLRHKKEGDVVNLEFDMFGKYIIKYLKNRGN